eukprot:scaffold223969_cov30-Tisochrysis_lutea.AAC.14
MVEGRSFWSERYFHEPALKVGPSAHTAPPARVFGSWRVRHIVRSSAQWTNLCAGGGGASTCRIWLAGRTAE